MPYRRQMPRATPSSPAGGHHSSSKRASPGEVRRAPAAHDKTPSPRPGRSRKPDTPSKLIRPVGAPVDEIPLLKDLCGREPRLVSPPPGLELISTLRDDSERPIYPCQPDADDYEEEPAAAAEDATAQVRRCTAAATRAARILRLTSEALRSKEAAACADEEGFVPITKLMRIKSDLQRETFGSTRAIISAVEAQPHCGVRLDRGHRRLRLKSAEELVRAIAESEVEASPQGTVPLQTLLSSPHLRSCLKPFQDPAHLVRRALDKDDSVVILRDTCVVRRPRDLQLRSAAEELFSDDHLAHDSRLRSKLAEGVGGAVPLTWLCARYMDRLGVAPPTGARATEVSAAELCDALKASTFLDVDPRRLTVRRSQPFRAPPSPGAGSPPNLAPPCSPASGKEARVATQLRQLLDFYFEPFTLQHNRYLLDLLARRVGPPEERGPWVAEVLLGFRCTLRDLLGLGRIASALSKAKMAPEALCADSPELQHLKHLRASPDGEMHLTTPLEVRSFVPAAGAPPELVDHVIRYLAAAREQRGQAPNGTVSVVSYSVGAVLADTTPHGQQRDARVKRQLLMHHADLVCLQGLDTDGRGEGLAATLSEDGYGFACARSQTGEANSVFWDRSRWEHCGSQECGAALAVDLSLIEDPEVRIRAVCVRPQIPYAGLKSIRDVFDVAAEIPIIACADLTLLGGVEGAAIVEELAGMESVAQEVLGEEAATPIEASAGDLQQFGNDGPMPLRSATTGLNKLRCSDAVLFNNLAPVVALSGHTEGYLATMAPEEVVRQFPAFRLPIVAAFDWRRGPGAHTAAASAAQAATSGPGQRFRL